MRKLSTLAATGAAVLALAACAPSLQEPPRTAELAVPGQFQAIAAGEAGDFADTDWVESFGSPTLTALVREALEHNRDLRAASARVAQARARARISGADLWPQIGLEAETVQSRTGLGSGGDSDATYRVGLGVTWEADLWGRLASQQRSAALTAEAAAQDYAAARLSLAGQVAEGWFSLIVAQQQFDLATRTVETYARSEQIVRERHRIGMATDLDLSLAVSNRQSAEALLRQREQQLREARRQLEVLLGRYPAAELAGGDVLPALPERPGTGVPAEVLARRPDLQAQFSRLMASRYGVAAAQRALLPRLTLTGSIGDSGTSLSDALDFKQVLATIIGNLTQPLFQGGRLRANVDLSRAQEDEAVQSYAQTVLKAMREVEDALGAETLLGSREAALEEAARQAAAAERLAEVQYTTGLTNLLTLLDSQRRNLEAQSQLLDVRQVRMNNRVRLHVALGGSVQPAVAAGQE
ncbi:efflux transporter outer membrane subunit [Pedomonas sp. V897]|uniref:efflux transporter outer membrane subunit n=1 Tax=Pedomonas sp. V897 TaxID=3446482 RepID=UPI003EE02A03